MPGRPFERDSMVEALRGAGREQDPFDVLVIGGGITGVGVALDAVARGLRTALVERDDFASGTSSKSSKLVHGGLRYLQNGDVRLVYEALRERRRLMRNAPHLVEVLPFLIPILTRDGVVSGKIARALGSAMWMYDLTGGWRIGKLHRRVSDDEVVAHFPTTDPERVSSGYVYYDATADDARLTLAIARTAAARGAVVVNRCEVVGIDHDDSGRATGVVVDVDGARQPVPATAIVNAAGVWSDEVRALDETTHPRSIRPAKGVHVTIPWELTRNDIAVIIPVRKDRRSLFLVPWEPLGDGAFRYTYVGTTDTDHGGDLDAPLVDHADVEYLLRALNDALTTTVTADDITGTWAGLRPLVNVPGVAPDSKTADLSRRHRVDVSESGVIRVTGGKLTTYREMAEDTVEQVQRRAGRFRWAFGRRSTRRLRLLGAERRTPGAPGTLDHHLGRRYGTLAPEVKALVAFDRTLGEPLVPGQPYLRAEAVYAVRHEMATTLTDVVLRRTRAHLFDRAATLAAAPDIARLLAGELGWDDAEIERQLDMYRAICADEEEASGRSAPVAHPTD